MKILETEWMKYRIAVIPREASATQVQESRRAFYSGAWAYYSLLMNALDAGTDDATPRDVAFMAKLDEEMREFAERVGKGWA
jgi:hypothetical protein